MKTIRWFFAVALLPLVLLGCSAIPLSTMLKMSSFDEQNFAELNGKDVRVRVRLPQPARLVVDKTELKTTLETQQGSHSAQLTLIAESERTYHEMEGILFPEPVAYSEYVLRLSDDALQQFARLQTLAPARSQERKSSFSFTARFTDLQKDQDTVVFSVDLLLSPQDGYFTLLDNATLKFKPQGA